jgi:hypothetical protein
MKPFVKNMATLGVTLILIFGLMEAGVRIYVGKAEGYPQKNSIFHHSLVPNAKARSHTPEYNVLYQINSYGLRDHEISTEKPPNTFRILMLGDSYTFGLGVNLEDTFSKKLVALLNQAGGSLHYEVVNGGCSSYSPILEYLFLLHRGLDLHPDLVLLNYDFSDVQDDHKYGEVAEFDSKGVPTQVHPVDVQWYLKDPNFKYHSGFFLLDYSQLYQFIMTRLHPMSGQKEGNLYFEKAQYIAGNIEYDRDIATRENAGDWKPYFDQSAKYLKLISDLLRSKGIPFGISGYPYGHLISDKEWAIGRKLRGFEDKIYSTRLFDYLSEFSRAENIPFLNMTPDFQSSGQFPLFYPLDGHFTPAGHGVAALSWKKFLDDKKLLPSH